MRPPHLGLLLFCVLLGLAVGTGVFTFGYAKGASYLTNDPAACANCHVMEAHFASWVKSSHSAVAVCNDCHTPHDLVGKYLTKASNGFWHSFAFTTGDFPDPIRIKDHNRAVTEEACRYCHADVTAAITAGSHLVGTGETSADEAEGWAVACTRCHRTVGHWVR
ncbi:MAG TPA: cytochrome c nitrite reductase small subunit [Rubricoccaceae bacterium]|nr:cytochrome c nitrite reductase small subunit [Rubricoccaceae bacterium]